MSEEKKPCPCKNKPVDNVLDNRITSFTDCNSGSVVWRIPFEVAVKMLLNMPPCEEKTKLCNATTISARRSNTFTDMLKSNGLYAG